jgi:precorrin-4/cobalt-precorrin-4 C11-methyltransferase
MVYIIGAGPGDPELITVKGKRILEKADIVIYAGSLVNRELLNMAKADCNIYDSAGMTLEEIISVMECGVKKGKLIARFHAGDPSIYGAIREQMDELEKRGIPYEVIPGVSSFCAAAAVMKKEYTLPGVSQTVILTRMEGRIEVPENESIESLSTHNATMIIFLSVHMLEKLVERLMHGYSADTPVAVVYKASWPEQKIIQGTLSSIYKKVKEECVDRTALVVVGRFLGDAYQLSKLYDKNFSHGYRGEMV